MYTIYLPLTLPWTWPWCAPREWHWWTWTACRSCSPWEWWPSLPAGPSPSCRPACVASHSLHAQNMGVRVCVCVCVQIWKDKQYSASIYMCVCICIYMYMYKLVCILMVNNTCIMAIHTENHWHKTRNDQNLSLVPRPLQMLWSKLISICLDSIYIVCVHCQHYTHLVVWLRLFSDALVRSFWFRLRLSHRRWPPGTPWAGPSGHWYHGSSLCSPPWSSSSSPIITTRMHATKKKKY